MSYSTGSGDYNALMAAVLAHAIGDGWTEAGGLGTGWPIVSPSGRIRGVDWDSYTAVEADATLGGDGLSKTQRYIRIGIGATPAGATAHLTGGTTCVVPNMAYTFTAWHIFSDLTVSEHIHVVVQFANGANSDVFGHFSFGELDKGGLTYNSIAYATSTRGRGYAVDYAGGATTPDSTLGNDWNTLNRRGNAFCGNWGEIDDGYATLTYMTHSTTAPHLNGVGGWPTWDTNINAGANVMSQFARSVDTAFPSLDADRDGGMANAAYWLPYNSVTGQVNLIPIPFVMINGTNSAARNIWMGTFPNVRWVGMDNITPGDEITFGGETWKLFPQLRKTDWSLVNVRFQVTSGLAGYAYKKVP